MTVGRTVSEDVREMALGNRFGYDEDMFTEPDRVKDYITLRLLTRRDHRDLTTRISADGDIAEVEDEMGILEFVEWADKQLKDIHIPNSKAWLEQLDSLISNYQSE